MNDHQEGRIERPQYADPPIGMAGAESTRGCEVQVDTPLENHLYQLSHIGDGLDCAAMGLNSRLEKLRGRQPEAPQTEAKIPLEPDALLAKLTLRADNLENLTRRINALADELVELI